MNDKNKVETVPTARILAKSTAPLSFFWKKFTPEKIRTYDGRMIVHLVEQRFPAEGAAMKIEKRNVI